MSQRLDDFTDLEAIVGAEQQASCGCSFVEAAPRGIDHRSGAYVTARELVLIPCAEGDAHFQLAKRAFAVGRDVPDVVEEFERLREESNG